MEVFGIIMTVASIMMSVYAQQVAAANASKAARFQAEQARRQAEDAYRVGEVEAEKTALRSSKFIGKQRALMGSTGVDLAAGSPLALTEESAAWGALDIASIAANESRVSFGFRGSANLYGIKAQSEKSNALVASTATIVGGAYDVYKEIKG